MVANNNFFKNNIFFIQHQAHQQPAARFTFAESATRASEGIDDTRIDLTQLDESGRSVSTVPSQSPRDTGSAIESSSTSAALTTAQVEPVAGTSTSSATEASVPQVLVTDDVEGNNFDACQSNSTQLDLYLLRMLSEDKNQLANEFNFIFNIFFVL